MDIGFLHLHTTIVLIFLLFLLFKTVLLVFNRLELLEKVRAKTRIVEMILGILILATGGYLLFKVGSIPDYLFIKLVLVFIAIPLGIIGIKKQKKLLAILAVLVFVYVYGMSETKSYKMKQAPFAWDASQGSAVSSDRGEAIYTQYCISCHGEDGRKGLYKAADLTRSSLNEIEQKTIIIEGKGLMRGYQAQLSEEDLQSLILYMDQLKNP
ncbi:MAG: c-type cytochrome [Cyclobacteriaceae bacterium]